jgi:Lysozyme like domain
VTGCQGQAGPGQKYTYAQLEGLWINNGGPASVAPIAAAIALAESGGCSTALNPTDNGGRQSSFGLWQISNGTHTPPVNNIYDPNVNAMQAVGKYQGGGGFGAWGTYNSGAYKPFMSGSTTPDTSVPGGSQSNPLGSGSSTPGQGNVSGSSDPTCAWGIHGGVPVLSSIPLIGNIYKLDVCFVRKTTVRHVMGGLILVAGGLVVLPGLVLVLAYGFRASGAARAVTQVISVMPAGRAASGAVGGGASRVARRASPAPAAARAS